MNKTSMRRCLQIGLALFRVQVLLLLDDVARYFVFPFDFQTGQEGLEPPTIGFGIRRSTIGATDLKLKKIAQTSEKLGLPYEVTYSITLDTTPEPTVLPPSRIAKRRPSSMAIGTRSSTLISTLSPGITISRPPNRLAVPVTSVVLK